jgi:hypothetical protein
MLWRRNSEPQPTPDEPGPAQCQQVPPEADTDAEQSGPVILGGIRTAREHAVALLDALLAAGLDGRSLLQSDMEEIHLNLCEQNRWIWRRWPAIGRELKSLGLRKTKVWAEGQRLTVYEIAAPASNVVALERERA